METSNERESSFGAALPLRIGSMRSRATELRQADERTDLATVRHLAEDVAALLKALTSVLEVRDGFRRSTKLYRATGARWRCTGAGPKAARHFGQSD